MAAGAAQTVVLAKIWIQDVHDTCGVQGNHPDFLIVQITLDGAYPNLSVRMVQAQVVRGQLFKMLVGNVGVDTLAEEMGAIVQSPNQEMREMTSREFGGLVPRFEPDVYVTSCSSFLFLVSFPPSFLKAEYQFIHLGCVHLWNYG